MAIAIYSIIGVLLIVIIFFSINIVGEKKNDVIQTLGKFTRIQKPGFAFLIPFIQYVAGTVNLRIQQIDVAVETKTLDNVFVVLKVSVQYKVNPDKVYEAHYLLDDTEKQINSYVFDVVRATVPKMKLDDVFANKEEIAKDVKKELDGTMDEFGYDIIKALVTDIDPAKNVKEAMNKINAAEREKIAAENEGEAEKIRKIKNAEAEAESKRLQGEGIANQRIAIVKGLKESVEDFKNGIPDATAKDVMNLVVVTQYFDTMKDIGSSDKSNTIFMPHSPSAVGDVQEQITTALFAAKNS